MDEGTILVAGLDVRELRLEVRFLQRDPGLVQEVFFARELFDALARGPARLVVLGPRLPDLPLVGDDRAHPRGAGERSRLDPGRHPRLRADRHRGGGARRRGQRGPAPAARPLRARELAGQAPRRAPARAGPHPGARPGGGNTAPPGEHFYGLTRNLSVHGMLLASPVGIEARTSTSRSTSRSPRVASACWAASSARPRRWAGPTSGTGSSSSSCPRPASGRSTAWSSGRPPRSPRPPVGPRGHPLHGAPGRVDLRDHRAGAVRGGLPRRDPAGRPRGLAPRAARAPSTSCREPRPSPRSTPPAASCVEHG